MLSYPDFIHRYRHTIIGLQDSGGDILPYYVHSDIHENEVVSVVNTMDEVLRIPYEDMKPVDYPELGYIYDPDRMRTNFFSRVPGSQWRRGFTFDSIRDPTDLSYNSSMSPMNLVLYNIFNPTYFSDVEAIVGRMKASTKRLLSMPLSKEFVIVKGRRGMNALKQNTRLIGYTTKDGSLVIPRSLDYLETGLEKYGRVKIQENY